MLIQTERLGRTSEQRRMFQFVGLPGRLTSVHLNRKGSINDGESLDYRF